MRLTFLIPFSITSLTMMTSMLVFDFLYMGLRILRDGPHVCVKKWYGYFIYLTLENPSGLLNHNRHPLACFHSVIRKKIFLRTFLVSLFHDSSTCLILCKLYNELILITKEILGCISDLCFLEMMFMILTLILTIIL